MEEEFEILLVSILALSDLGEGYINYFLEDNFSISFYIF
jgi:hypothetical protein